MPLSANSSDVNDRSGNGDAGETTTNLTTDIGGAMPTA
jgi:hypothetical protein